MTLNSLTDLHTQISTLAASVEAGQDIKSIQAMPESEWEQMNDTEYEELGPIIGEVDQLHAMLSLQLEDLQDQHHHTDMEAVCQMLVQSTTHWAREYEERGAEEEAEWRALFAERDAKISAEESWVSAADEAVGSWEDSGIAPAGIEEGVQSVDEFKSLVTARASTLKAHKRHAQFTQRELERQVALLAEVGRLRRQVEAEMERIDLCHYSDGGNEDDTTHGL